MLKWALIFLVISLVAGALGFTGISSAAGKVAKFLFFLFLFIFVAILVAAVMLGQAIF